GVAADDLGLLGRLLLADAHRTPLLRALEEVLLEAALEVRRAEDLRRAHAFTLARRRASSTSACGEKGLVRTASAAFRYSSTSAEPVTSATGMPSARRCARRACVSWDPRCTSRSTTSGRCARTAASASSVVAASVTSNP